VSEAKFRAHPAVFIPHILRPNRAALSSLITKPEVERALLQRVQSKTSTYGQDFGPCGQPVISKGMHNGDILEVSVGVGAGKIDVGAVVDLYEFYIIPVTKEVEVDYLLRRLDGLSPEEIDTLAKQEKK